MLDSLMLFLDVKMPITYLILILFEMVVCVLGIIGAFIAKAVIRQDNSYIITAGIVGSIIGEVVWRMFTSYKFEMLMDNMLVSICFGFLAVIIVWLIEKFSPKSGIGTDNMYVGKK